MSNFKQVLIRPEDLLEWLGRRISPEKADWLGISPRQYQMWLNRPQGIYIPLALWRLMQYQGNFRLEELLGPDWAGFEVRGQYLRFPGLRAALDVKEFLHLHRRHQERGFWESQAQRHEKELARAHSQIDDMENQIAFLKRQIKLESAMGLMLTRITD